jgi:Mn2+/Fe2+ NRAMP family transporter
MGNHANTVFGNAMLWTIGVIVTILNIMLLVDMLK